MPALSIATRSVWTSIAVTWDDGGGSPIVWGPPAGVTDGASALDDLVATLGGGAWWQASRSMADAAMGAVVNTGTAYTVTANTAAQSLMGWPASQGPTTSATCSSIEGTVYPLRPYSGQMLRRWWRTPDAEGEAALVPGAPGTAAIVPSLSMSLDAIEASRLTAALAIAAAPRVARYTDDPASSAPTWRAIALGRVTRSQLGPLTWAARLEVRG